VPAAAVIRKGLALLGITGRNVKNQGLTLGLRSKLRGLSLVEGNGIPGVAVKCVDIGKNTEGEGSYLCRD
jgi:hypothetical protein